MQYKATTVKFTPDDRAVIERIRKRFGLRKMVETIRVAIRIVDESVINAKTLKEEIKN